jgi:hypothetical protein
MIVHAGSRDDLGVEQFAETELYPAIDPVSDRISALIDLQVRVAGEAFAANTATVRPHSPDADGHGHTDARRSLWMGRTPRATCRAARRTLVTHMDACAEHCCPRAQCGRSDGARGR